KSRAPRVSTLSKAQAALEALDKLGISVFELIATVLDPIHPCFASSRNAFSRRDTKLIPRILSLIFDNPTGNEAFCHWLPPNFARDQFCGKISEQMEAAKPMFYMKTRDFTLEFLETFDLRAVSDLAAIHLPDWVYVLQAATGCFGSESGKKIAATETGRAVLTCQVMNMRSVQCAKLQYILGLSAWATGTSKQTMEIMGSASLSVSSPTVLKIIKTVADQAVTLASKVSYGPHMFTYDNIDLSNPEHVEQTKEAISKVRSGTFPLLYKLSCVLKREHMLLEPIVENMRKAIPLQIYDVWPTRAQLAAYKHQSITNVIHALGRRLPQFEYVLSDPELQHKPRRPLPSDLRTEFFPLRTTTFEEKSIIGNLQNQDDAYIRQICIISRQGDMNSWLRRLVFALGIAIFHMLMNLIWGLRTKHYGSTTAPGSLVYFFILLEKKRLANDKPDFHALSSALLQILDGILLSGWIRECGYTSFTEFAESTPNAAKLRDIASQSLEEIDSPEKPEVTSDDNCHRNIRLLARDLLVVAEITAAVPQGDFGRIEDLLPDLAAMFRSAGSNKYATEIITLLHNLKYVWTPEFA
ncbi:hypothetical protein BDP27DRAFT_1226836, partial [Rhodocollybia butyracea]